MSTPENPPAEDPELSYEVCRQLIQQTRHALTQCAGNDDPVQARAQFDLIRRFCAELQRQTDRIADPAARETCLMQLTAVIREGRQIAPTIPVICPDCWTPWLPDEPPPEPPLCSDCRPA